MANITPGTATDATRTNVQIAKYNDPWLICIQPNLNISSPELWPYKSTDIKLPEAAIQTGQVWRKTYQGVTPAIANNSISKPNAIEAETISNVTNIGKQSNNAPIKRLIGLSLRINQEGETSRSLSKRLEDAVTSICETFNKLSKSLTLILDDSSALLVLFTSTHSLRYSYERTLRFFRTQLLLLLPLKTLQAHHRE